MNETTDREKIPNKHDILRRFVAVHYVAFALTFAEFYSGWAQRRC